MDAHAVSHIFGYLFLHDAIQLCYTSKQYYALLPICFKYSFTTAHIDNAHAQHANHITGIVRLAQLHGCKQVSKIQLDNRFCGVWSTADLVQYRITNIVIARTSRFNSPLDLSSMLTLRNVFINAHFNNNLSLPNNLHTLRFSHDSRFDRTFEPPPGLRRVYFGAWYNQPFIAPLGLRVLQITEDSKFNQSIVFPDSLEEVYFGRAFNKPVHLTPNLRVIKFCRRSEFNAHFFGTAPHLEWLSLGSSYAGVLFPHMFPSVKKIRFAPACPFNNVLCLYGNVDIYLGRHFNSLIITGEGSTIMTPTHSRFRAEILYVEALHFTRPPCSLACAFLYSAAETVSPSYMMSLPHG